MKFVIDTNVFVEAISPNSPYHSIFKSLMEGEFSICISNEILLEYEEVITEKFSPVHFQKFMGFMSYSPFVLKFQPSYRFNLITTDPDDNKFVDCAICAAAQAIITSDKDFQVLKRIDFPKVNVMTPNEFISKILKITTETN